MRNTVLTVVFGFFVVVAAHAVDTVDQRYINQLTRGGNASIKQAAESIYHTGRTSTEVLDVAAEVLLQRYPTARDYDIDTLSWVSKALGASRNGRYHNTLQEVVDSKVHRKLRKYAKQAMRNVGEPTGPQYQKGSVNLAVLRNTTEKASVADKAAVKAAAKSVGKQGLDVVQHGMSMQEVYALVGNPTATTSHQTGKAWVPFNFAAKDLARSTSVYKGQGRVVFSHDGYSSTARVVEIILDPNETGYP